MRLLEDVHSNSWNGSRASAVPCPLVSGESSEASYVEPFNSIYHFIIGLRCCIVKKLHQMRLNFVRIQWILRS